MSKQFKSNKNNHKKSIIPELLQFLASTYSVYLKSQNFHWNVTGSNFLTLHSFFQKQYEELATAVDDIAERIRALDTISPGSYAEFAKLSQIKDSIGKKSASKMISELLDNHLSMIHLIRELISTTKECQDDATQDLLIRRLNAHEKTIWILKSLKFK